MKNILLPLLTMILHFCNAQSDTVTIEKTKTIIGSVSKNYTDRIIISDKSGNDFMVTKDRITSFNIRSRAKYNGIWGIEYVSDMKVLNTGTLPEFHDMKSHLRDAGTLGIISGALIVGGGILSGVGAVLNTNRFNGNTTITAGSAIASIGTALLIPTFIFILKAGKVKSYRIP